MENKLKSCPFCGGEAEIITVSDARFIRCEECYIKVDVYDTKEEAIAAWNTRTNTIPVGNGENYEVQNNV